MPSRAKLEEHARGAAMPDPLPLPTLLSRVLVAFTIEFDSEFEHQMPHRTTGSTSASSQREGPWLVSMVMWLNFMQFVREDGVSVRELQSLTRLPTKAVSNWLVRMSRWWGYVTVRQHSPNAISKTPAPDWIVRPTSGGLQAQKIWRPLIDIVEQRWRVRFDAQAISTLHDSLSLLVSKLDVELPAYLPVLGYGSRVDFPVDKALPPAVPASGALLNQPLPTLLSNLLLAFTLDFERESDLSLAISANVLRLLDEQECASVIAPSVRSVEGGDQDGHGLSWEGPLHCD